MKLSDVVSAMDLSIFAEVPLLIFFGVFVLVVIRLLQGEKQFEKLRMLPLESTRAEESQR